MFKGFIYSLILTYLPPRTPQAQQNEPPAQPHPPQLPQPAQLPPHHLPRPPVQIQPPQLPPQPAQQQD